jgi:hypothetical protein
MLRKSFGKNHIAIVFLLFSLLLLLTSCSQTMKSNQTEKFKSDTNEAKGLSREDSSDSDGFTTDSSTSTAKSEGVAKENTSTQVAAPLDARKKIIEKTMHIETKEFDRFYSTLKNQITINGGYVEQSNVTGNRTNQTSMRYATIKIRIPVNQLDGFLSKVTSLGTVVEEEDLTKDVTLEYIDVESRINALQIERDSLMRLMETASTLENLLTVQSRLTDVRADLESFATKQRTFDDLIAYSTVNMNIGEVARITPQKPKSAWEQIQVNFKENLYDIGDGFRACFIWFAGNIPNIILFVLFLALAVLIIRAFVKRMDQRSNVLGNPPPTDPIPTKKHDKENDSN